MKSSIKLHRYSLTAMLFHWVTAGLVISLFGVGYRMTRLPEENISDIFSLYQLHKSLGVSLLLLTGARLLHRFFVSPPQHTMNPLSWEYRMARVAHALLYGLCIIVPLLGWAMVSSSPYNIPTVVFGLWEWPHLPPFDTLQAKASVEAILKTTHKIAAYSLLALIFLHLLAALRHHFVLKDTTLLRMLPTFFSHDGSHRHDQGNDA